jgi:hypothetical protein
MSRGSLVALVLSLAAFLALAMGNIATTSPTFDEPFHLAAGYTQLTTRDHRFGPDHPPLLRRLAALLLLGMEVWPQVRTAEGTRPLEVMQQAWSTMPFRYNAPYFFDKHFFFPVRDALFGTPTTTALAKSDFLNDAEAMFFRARTTLLFATGALLAILVFCWSYELWGPWGGAWSALLFCFDPNFIAHSGLVTTDAGAAMLMFASLYFFWRATRGATRRATLANGLAFALAFAAALLAKYSSLILLPVLLLLAVWRGERIRRAALIAGALVVAFLAIWAAYGFRFQASAVDMRVEVPVKWWYGIAELIERHPEGPPPGAPLPPDPAIGLGGRALLLAEELRLLPQPYLYGFADMRSHTQARGSFLRGEFATLGFRSYFFWTFLYKTPLVAMLAIAAGIVVAIRARSAALPFLLLPVALYLAASIPSSMNIGHRHLLPIYPFLYVLAGALVTVRARRIVIAAVPLVVAAALVVFAPWQPVVNHHLAYFNELAGGPVGGRDLLVDSNIDWGQDLPRLARWLREHDVREPVNLVYFGTADPRAWGIRYVNLERGYYLERVVPPSAARVPGILAISVTALRSPNSRDHELWPRLLRGREPIGRAGYSILIYRIDAPLAAP